MSLTIETRDVGNVVVLDLSGHSEISDGIELQQKVRGLIEEGRRLFVLNLQNTRYLDSFGLGQLVSTFLSVRDHSGQIRITNANPQVRDLLRYSRVDTVLQVLSGESEAVQELQKQASL